MGLGMQKFLIPEDSDTYWAVNIIENIMVSLPLELVDVDGNPEPNQTLGILTHALEYLAKTGSIRLEEIEGYPN